MKNKIVVITEVNSADAYGRTDEGRLLLLNVKGKFTGWKWKVCNKDIAGYWHGFFTPLGSEHEFCLHAVKFSK